jgi:transposase-like protein
MTPIDFCDYFKNCAVKEQQAIVEELLTLSNSQVTIKNSSETKAISYPHFQSKSVRGNSRLKEVQRYVCKVRPNPGA